MNAPQRRSLYHLLATIAAAASLVSVASGLLPQLQMFLLAGQMITNSVPKVALVLCVVLGIWQRPKISLAKFPISTWQISVVFLLFDIVFLWMDCGVNVGDTLQSYNMYYSTILIAPAILAFRGAVSERLLIRWTTILFLLCAVIGVAQYVTAQPLLYTESADRRFEVQSWQFFDDVRAFSLFSSGLEFGVFCSLCGALGVALVPRFPWRGVFLAILSAFACYTTLTRNCYLMFFCTCTYSAIMTFGKKRSRGLLAPIVYLAIGAVTIFAGVISFKSGTENNLQSASSLIERVVEWTYFIDQIVHASLIHQALGLGLVQRTELDQTPVPVDNMAIAIILHVGVVGLLLLGALTVRMWLYLRRQALAHQQPFVIAAASLWATLPFVGIFAIVPAAFGTIFTLAILCESQDTAPANP